MPNGNYVNALTFTQKVQSKYFNGWSDEELATLEECECGNAAPLINVIASRFLANGIVLEECYGIAHNLDDRAVYDESMDDFVIEQKDTHVHILFVFGNVKDTKHKPTIADVESAIGVVKDGDSSPLQKLGKGRYAKENVLAYWIHANDAFKHQYSPKAVYTFCGTDYMEIYARYKDKWAASRATKKKKQNKLSLDSLVDGILHGKYDKTTIYLTDSLYEVYCTGLDACDKAFKAYGERKAALAVKKMQNGEFITRVFFVYGKAGSGKSSFANGFVKWLVDKAKKSENESWSVYNTAATNPLDDYAGEEIVFMDDVRGATMSASDWLKLLDPYNATPSSARYKNKTCAARAIIITSTKDPLEFFYYMKNLGSERGEAMDQFIRRIQAMVIPVREPDDTVLPSYAKLCEGVKLNKETTFLAPISKDGSALLQMNYAFADEGTISVEDAFEKLGDMVFSKRQQTKVVDVKNATLGDSSHSLNVSEPSDYNRAFGL